MAAAIPAWLMAASVGSSALGDILGASEQQKSDAERKREFNLQYGLQKGAFDQSTQRYNAADPTRRLLMQALAKRFGLDLGAGFGGGSTAPSPTASTAMPGASTGSPFGAQYGSPSLVNLLQQRFGLNGNY